MLKRGWDYAPALILRRPGGARRSPQAPSNLLKRGIL